MSDFGELCPLFNTGVFHEVTFSNIDISMTTMTATVAAYNMLTGSLSASHSDLPDPFTFGRTVVVTAAWLKRITPNNAKIKEINLDHRTSAGAAPTTFGTATLTSTECAYGCNTIFPMTVTAKTFTSDEVLGLCPITYSLDATLGTYDLIVRYKDK